MKVNIQVVEATLEGIEEVQGVNAYTEEYTKKMWEVFRRTSFGVHTRPMPAKVFELFKTLPKKVSKLYGEE